MLLIEPTGTPNTGDAASELEGALDRARARAAFEGGHPALGGNLGPASPASSGRDGAGPGPDGEGCWGGVRILFEVPGSS